MPVTILPVTPHEVGIVAKLSRRIWPISYAGVLTPQQIENLLMRIYSEENLKREMEQGHHFRVAYDGKEPVGYASAYKEGEIIWLKKIYVLPSRQKEGIGAALMQAVTKHLMPARQQRLLVNCKNHAACNAYERMGFERVGETPVQMGDYQFMDFIFSRPL